MRTSILAAALLGLTAAPVLAQQKGTWEIGAFGRFNDYDGSYEVTRQSANGWGAGGRIGYFVAPKWSVELDGSGNWTDVKNFFIGFESTALTYYPFHLRFLFNQRMGGETGLFTWILGAGFSHNRYGKDVPTEPGFDGTDWSFGGLAGFRIGLTDKLALRVDGTVDYIWNPNNGKPEIVNQFQGIVSPPPADENVNLAVQAGLSFFPNICDKERDGTTVSPTRSSLEVGASATFVATATHCGKSDVVVWSLSGPGRLDNGRYTASDSGSAVITACGQRNRFCSTANVEVMPPERVVSVTLSPPAETRNVGETVVYTVTARTNRGATRQLTNCTLASEGATVNAYTLSWSTAGEKTVTATCPEGGTATARVTVRAREIEIVRTPIGAAAGKSRYQVDQAAIFRPEDQDTLRKIGALLREYPETKIAIDGHTDSDASVAHNDSLGMRRAESVKEFLRAEGVPVDRMTIILRSYGECKPVAGNDREAGGRAVNRRAELYSFRNESDLEPASASCPDTRRRPLPQS
ncbi:MAG: OmpA family protein [Gemmatimonadales bacterium]